MEQFCSTVRRNVQLDDKLVNGNAHSAACRLAYFVRSAYYNTFVWNAALGVPYFSHKQTVGTYNVDLSVQTNNN